MVSIVLLILALASHVLPHPWWNFTAVGGALLVWGGRRSLATAIMPVAALAVGDWYLTRFVYGFAFHVNSYLLTWAWYALVVLLGHRLLRGRPGFARVVSAAIVASTSFFIASNYAVWAVPGSWYPHTFQGLGLCYTMALPFYRNDVISTLLVTGAVFGLPALAARLRTEDSPAASRA